MCCCVALAVACGPADFLGAGPCGSSGDLRTGGAFGADVARCIALMPTYVCQPSIPHVIPRRLIQILNLRRWNCNVSGVYRKMTAINYVRNLGGGGVGAARFGRPRRELRSALRLVVRPRIPRAPRPAGPAARPCGPSGAPHAGGGGGFAALEAGCRRVAGVSWF